MSGYLAFDAINNTTNSLSDDWPLAISLVHHAFALGLLRTLASPQFQPMEGALTPVASADA